MRATHAICVALVALACCVHAITASRELPRTVPLRGDSASGQARTCRNTVQGRSLITDDTGTICKRSDVDFATGCCKSGELHSCSTCSLGDSCCEELEYCVSCCLKPEHKPDVMYKTRFRARRRPDVGNFTDEFDYCLGTCRTHAHSTSHENDYIGARHHCFSALGRPLLSGPVPKEALAGVSVEVSSPGGSCDKACEAKGLACSASHFAVLNGCDRLRERVGCEAGCEYDDFHPYLPGYVVAQAPKQEHPALCIIHKQKEQGTCAATKDNLQRLCPCTAKDTAASTTA